MKQGTVLHLDMVDSEHQNLIVLTSGKYTDKLFKY